MTKNNATDNNLDIASVSRYHHITNSQFEDIFSASTFTQQNSISKEYGLRNSYPILDQLQRERHLQSPQDIYHLMAGKTLKLLKATIDLLSPDGKQKFISVWKSFEYPYQWSKLPNPISHVESFMMSDLLKLGMVMPFILNRFLTTDFLKQLDLAKLQTQAGLHHNQVINAIIKCWSITAKCTWLAFNHSLTNKDYEDLDNLLKTERELLTKVRIYILIFFYTN